MQCVFLNTKIKSSKYHFAIELYLHITALPAINDITCMHTTALHALYHIMCIALLAEVSI